ncbi:MAG: hypothetical protein ACREO1_02375 [Arenimonas sp.]
MNADHLALLRKGIETYLSHYDDGDLEPIKSYLPYDFEDEINRYEWQVLADVLVRDELREVTNILNGWVSSLLQWHAWNRTLESFDEQSAWELRREFVEASAHQCLLQPSSVRDMLVFTATNAFHQIRLSLENGYKDYLEGDPTKPGDRPKHLSRRRKEKRLERLMTPWPAAAQWFYLLRQIDDSVYRETTFDYRNRSAHAIAPRLAVGHVGTVTRWVEQATELKRQENGFYSQVPVPGKMVTCYGFGGTPPLDMEKARIVNLEQYLRARQCFESYRRLVSDAMAEMPLKT